MILTLHVLQISRSLSKKNHDLSQRKLITHTTSISIPPSFPVYTLPISTLSHLKSATYFFAFSTFNAAKSTAPCASLITCSPSE
jgi:hypothetical protein